MVSLLPCARSFLLCCPPRPCFPCCPLCACLCLVAPPHLPVQRWLSCPSWCGSRVLPGCAAPAPARQRPSFSHARPCPCPTRPSPRGRIPLFDTQGPATHAVGSSWPCCHPCGGHPPLQRSQTQTSPCTITTPIHKPFASWGVCSETGSRPGPTPVLWWTLTQPTSQVCPVQGSAAAPQGLYCAVHKAVRCILVFVLAFCRRCIKEWGGGGVRSGVVAFCREGPARKPISPPLPTHPLPPSFARPPCHAPPLQSNVQVA